VARAGSTGGVSALSTLGPVSRREKQAARRATPDEQLSILGLRRGERVRWRPGPSGRWLYGSVRGREHDGSIAVTEDGGAFRSIPVARLDVQTLGARGGERWELVTVRAGRAEQLSLDLFFEL
jgi:hypothetical protein